jgi:hypothetical protein
MILKLFCSAESFVLSTFITPEETSKATKSFSQNAQQSIFECWFRVTAKQNRDNNIPIA